MTEKLLITKGKVKGNDGYKTFSIRLPENLVDKIDNIAYRSLRSRNELINILLLYAVKNCYIEDNDKTDAL